MKKLTIFSTLLAMSLLTACSDFLPKISNHSDKKEAQPVPSPKPTPKAAPAEREASAPENQVPEADTNKAAPNEGEAPAPENQVPEADTNEAAPNEGEAPAPENQVPVAETPSKQAQSIASLLISNTMHEIVLEEGKSTGQFFSIKNALKPCKKIPRYMLGYH